jgi:hypothetical protein
VVLGKQVMSKDNNTNSQEQENEKPSRKECQTAIKILTQYERLAKKFGKKIGDSRVRELNSLRDSGEITINDLPATLRSEYPTGKFGNMNLKDIRDMCGM